MMKTQRQSELSDTCNKCRLAERSGPALPTPKQSKTPPTNSESTISATCPESTPSNASGPKGAVTTTPTTTRPDVVCVSDLSAGADGLCPAAGACNAEGLSGAPIAARLTKTAPHKPHPIAAERKQSLRPGLCIQKPRSAERGSIAGGSIAGGSIERRAPSTRSREAPRKPQIFTALGSKSPKSAVSLRSHHLAEQTPIKNAFLLEGSHSSKSRTQRNFELQFCTNCSRSS